MKDYIDLMQICQDLIEKLYVTKEKKISKKVMLQGYSYTHYLGGL